MQRCKFVFPLLLLIVHLTGTSCRQPSLRQRPEGYRTWRVRGGTPESIRYSSLDQINRSNVRQLRVAWVYHTGDAYPGSEMQCNPIIIGRTLYATTPALKVIALDAASGKLLWRFDPFAGQKPRGKLRNRGVAYWEDGQDRRIFVVAGHHLYALDASNGTPIPSFGQAGKVDLREGLGRPPETVTITATSPGIVYRDLLILGSTVPESLPSAPGDIRAYDVRTGRLRWSFHTIPRPGEYGYETWPPEAWKWVGGANNWCGMSLDEQRGIVYVPTGSAAFDFYGGNRHGDNLFANTLLALDAATGKRLWHFQVVRHDVWDRDLPAQPALVTVERNGRLIDAVAQATKSGHLFVFHRETGTPLFPIDERPVPPSDIPGEKLAPAQPIPRLPPPFARQQLTESLLTRRTEAAHQAVLKRFRQLRSGPQFTPPSFEGTIIFPGFDGGAEWGGVAFDPETGILYVNANEMAWVLRLVPRGTTASTARRAYLTHCAACHGQDMSGSGTEFPGLRALNQRYSEHSLVELLARGRGRMPAFEHLGRPALEALARYLLHGRDLPLPAAPSPSPFELPYTHDGYNKFLDPDGYPAVRPPWGTLTAIDLDTGHFVWQIPLGEIPELALKGMKDTGSENYGGPLVTAGGLVFIAATVYDRKFRAFDKLTGRLLWETELPAAGNATPATYEVDGRQYVVIAAGGGKWGQPSADAYVAFSLP